MVNFNHANVVASSRGRIRIEIPQLYRSLPVKLEIEAEICSRGYVTAVYANPLSARVLILFDPAFPADMLLAELGVAIVEKQKDDKSKYHVEATPHDIRSERKPPQKAKDNRSLQHPMYPPWHLRETDAAVAFFGSSQQRGLAQAVAEERLRNGLNLLSPQKAVSFFDILLNQFKSLPVLLLGISAALSVVTGGVAEAIAIVAVLALNGGIGVATEWRAETAIASLSGLIDDIVPVLREGEVRQVETSLVVPGDILVLAPGIKVAADARLLRANGLSVDESALTGESLPVSKDSAALERAVALADRSNMVYRGTAVSMGTGLGLVVGTGNNTEIGAIQALTTSTERPRTPIQIQLDQLGNQLVKVSSAICLGIFALGLLRRYNWLPMFKASISLAIAAVPEGLPTVATTSLARGIRLMRDKNVLIRRLHAVETIGALQTICLDKTGTLTMNRMSVVVIHTNRQTLMAREGQADWLTLSASDLDRTELARLLQICVLCNQAELDSRDRTSSLNGSATENALLDLAAKAGVSTAEMRQRFPLLMTELRAEGRNYMRTIHTMPDSRRRLCAVKGSPEEVLALCGHYQVGEHAVELNEALKADIVRQNQDMAEQQLRVLGFAFAEVPPSAIGEIGEQKLTWVGLVGLADPLRPGVERVIADFHRAGIRTVMLTGDQAATAYVIGKSLHLNNGDKLHIVNSERIEQIKPELLDTLAEHAHIFSRVSPAHKLQIVRALQKNGKTIAMTGDGINDGPALRAADIGIAMGRGGTDLARSAADVILMDDQLETVLEAIRQGRTISTNIRKSLHFLISSNLSEILVVLGAISLGSGPPLTPMQLLWLNLLSDVLPAVALAAEPPEHDVMSQAPRDPNRPIVGKEELWRYAREGGCLASGALAAYLYGTARYGSGARAGTIAFNSLVLGQLLHAISCRSDRRGFFDTSAPSNRQLTLAIGASIALHVLANVLPGLRRLLGVAPLGVMDLFATLAGAGVPLLLNELAKPGYSQSSAPTSASAERSTSFSTKAPTSLSVTGEKSAPRVIRRPASV